MDVTVFAVDAECRHVLEVMGKRFELGLGLDDLVWERERSISDSLAVMFGGRKIEESMGESLGSETESGSAHTSSMRSGMSERCVPTDSSRRYTS